MKKYFFFALTAAMMSFAGCQEKELEAPVNPNQGGSTFELVADIAQTKTTLDATDYSVEWETGDIVYLVTSDGTWGAPYVDKDNTNLETIAEFVYADGRFTSDAAITAGEYTFKAMYAHESQKSYHRGESSTHKLQSTQTQDCANPTAHIKGNDALVGMFTAYVPATDKQAVTMSHLYTLMQVNVRNSTGASVDVTKFEMTAAGADLAGVFNVDFKNTAITTKSSASSTITVNVTGGNVDAGQALPVYFVMAPLSDYTGDVTFKVTAADGKTYTKTIAVSNLDFNAGAYNTTPYTISEADVVEPEQTNVTWNLAIDETSEATENRIAWTSDFAEMYCEKSGASTPANNYYGGNGQNSTRFYKNSVLTIAPKSGYAITSVVFEATTDGYATALGGSTWTNASASASSKTVTVTPTDGTKAMVATLAGTCGCTSVVVYYEVSEGGETPETPETPGAWTLVTNVSDLAVGDEIIIAAKDYDFAVGAASANGNNRTQASVTKSGNTLTPGEGVMTFTLQAGTKADTYALYTGAKYLYAASSGSNYLKEKDALDDNGSWSITIADNGVATIIAQGSYTRNVMRYNDGSSLFSCYEAGKQKDVAIYKQMSSSGNEGGGETPEPEPKVLESIAVSGAKTNYVVGDEFVKPTVTATYNDATTADVTASATFSGYNMNTAGTQTVTVSYTEGEKTATTTYQITVVESQNLPKGIASIKSEATSTEGTDFAVVLTDAVVTYVSGLNAYIEDAEAGILIYKSGHGLAAGDKLNGVVSGTVKLYNNLREITSIDYSKATRTTGADVPVTVVTLAQLNADGAYDKYENMRVKVIDATVSETKQISQGDQTYALYFKGQSLTGFDLYNIIDVIGYPSKFNDAIQFNVWENAVVKGASKTTITVASAVTVKVGETKAINATASSGAKVSYVSANPSVATVGEDGTVTGVAEGNTTITVSVPAYNGYPAAEEVCNVTVTAAGGNEGGTADPVTLIIDGSTLTSTATTADSDHTFGGVTLTMSKGAKYQNSNQATNAFSKNPAILIGKSGAYIYNKTPIPGRIVKFEIYANAGASAKVSVGVNFSSTQLSKYNSSAANTYTNTLNTLDSVYDCSAKLPDDAQYFWYQVTNGYNSQVQFRITYIPEN